MNWTKMTIVLEWYWIQLKYMHIMIKKRMVLWEWQDSNFSFQSWFTSSFWRSIKPSQFKIKLFKKQITVMKKAQQINHTHSNPIILKIINMKVNLCKGRMLITMLEEIWCFLPSQNYDITVLFLKRTFAH